MTKTETAQVKLTQLQESLRALNRIAIAYSGGTDSAFLLKIAHDVLGDGILALTADSPSQPRAELAEARAIAAGSRRPARGAAHA